MTSTLRIHFFSKSINICISEFDKTKIVELERNINCFYNNWSFQDLYVLTHQNEEILKTLQTRQEFFVIRYQEQQRFIAEAHHAEQQNQINLQQEFLHQKERFDNELNFEGAQMLLMRQKLLTKLSDTFHKLQDVQQHILDLKLGAVSWN